MQVPNALAGLIRGTILNDLGIQVANTLQFNENKFSDLGTFKLAPVQCGPAASMFTSIEVSVKCGATESAGYLIYEYAYKHHSGGTNGLTVRTTIELTGQIHRN